MTLGDVLFFMFVSFGICNALQYKLVFLRGRWDSFDALLDCSFCTGFHSGWLTWLLVWGMMGVMPAEGWMIPFSLTGWALASSATCYVLDALTGWFTSQMVK